MVRYQYKSQDNAKANTFELRLARLSLDGRILNDFYWKAQIQFNGNTSTLGSSPRLLDLFTEWQKWPFLRVKLGQFKNPFTFENPVHPIDQGFRANSMVIQKLAGFSDRTGEHSSNGRDIGLQLQGDLINNSHGRPLLHYQVGVFNGQGINMSDVDQQKNLIGGIWLMPIQGMRLGAFGWTGSYARKGSWTELNPQTMMQEAHKGVRSLPQRRYAFSGEYMAHDWTVRSEYAHSTGNAFSTTLTNTDNDNAKNCQLSNNGDKAQGVYAMVIAPIIQHKMHAKARYDMYQPTGNADKQFSQYEIGLDYELCRNLQISGEYAFVHDRGAVDHDYNVIDVEVSYRF